jgi:uncharacterized protein YjiK
MNYQKRKIAFSVLLITSILGVNCGNSDIEGSGNTTAIDSLEQLAIYNLDISEPSGITYNSQIELFMIVSDDESDIFLVDSIGNVRGKISTSGSDMEGIAVSKNCDTIFVVEETKRLVSSYTISGSLISSFSVDVATNSEHALEGIARSPINGRLTVLNEKLPCMLLEYDNSKEFWRKEIRYSSDISDIFYDENTNCFWVTSDEARKVLKLSSEFDLISEWRISVNQAEGITILRDKIYIVSDSESKMYVFQKPN